MALSVGYLFSLASFSTLTMIYPTLFSVFVKKYCTAPMVILVKFANTVKRFCWVAHNLLGIYDSILPIQVTRQ